MPIPGRSALLRLALSFVFTISMTHGEEVRLSITSTHDGSMQPSLFYPAESNERAPLLVVLHTWSNDIDRWDAGEWRNEAKARGWHLLAPNFRGANNRPEACASAAARQDILDAVAHVRESHAINDARIYLAGVSGGGHMAMVMAAHAPELWTGVSAWVGISDLAAWHAESKSRDLKYWRDVEAVAGGAPESSPEIDAALRFRSPVYHLAAAHDVPMDLNTGIHDGHTGSVPIHHTLDAFNVIAKARGAARIDDETIARLSGAPSPTPDLDTDPEYGRVIHLRRHAGDSRVTIFEGGHEGLPSAACAWLDRIARETN